LYYLATDIIIGRDIYKKYEKINVSKFKDDILQFISNVEKDKSMSVILNEALRYYGKYDDSNNMLSIAKSLQIAQDDNLELKDLILIGKSIIFSNEFFNIISITDYNSTKEDSIFNNDISDTGFPELKFFSNNLNLLLDRMLIWGRSFIDIDSIIDNKFALYIYISNGFTYKFMLSFLLLLVEIDITNFFREKGYDLIILKANQLFYRLYVGSIRQYLEDRVYISLIINNVINDMMFNFRHYITGHNLKENVSLAHKIFNERDNKKEKSDIDKLVDYLGYQATRRWKKRGRDFTPKEMLNSYKKSRKHSQDFLNYPSLERKLLKKLKRIYDNKVNIGQNNSSEG
jgi:hypothetical protein